MISNLILVTASSCFVGALYYNKKQSLFKNIFDDLRNCQSYHMDYIQDIKHIPLNKYVILFGPAHSLISNQKIISPSFIQKQQKSISKDRLWNFVLKDSFYMETAEKQRVIIQATTNKIQESLNYSNDSNGNNGSGIINKFKHQSLGKKIMGFNLPLTNRQLRDNKYQQRAIIDNIAVCCYGKLTNNNTNNTNNNNKTNQYKMIPRVIIGNKHQSLLVYLDEHIVNLNRRGKILGVLGFSIFATHAFYKFVWIKNKQSSKHIVEIQMQQQPTKTTKRLSTPTATNTQK